MCLSMHRVCGFVKQHLMCGAFCDGSVSEQREQTLHIL